VNLWDIEAVKQFITNSEWCNNTKSIVEYAYADWCAFNEFKYKPRKYPRETSIPHVPLEKNIDQLIAGFRNSKYAPLLQLLKESGFRPIEAFRLTPSDFDLEQQILTLNKPAKNSLPRQLKMSDKLTAMITPLIRKTSETQRIWSAKPRHIKRTYQLTRDRIAKKLANLRLKQIKLSSFRHYIGTMTYHKTKDILYTQRVLGHKNIQNTLVYTHLVNFESDEYVCKIAKSIDEAGKLVEAGFDFVTQFKGKMLFKKRK
jgi:integrase